MSESRDHTLEGRGFDRVLDAETAADARIDAATARAGEVLQAARAEERRIAARTDGRLQALYGDINAMIERERVRMVQAFEAKRRDLVTPPPPDRIIEAARRLARRLAGIDAT